MEQSEQILCKVAFWYYRRMALMFLLFAGGGLWFFYDGLIGWPQKNKIHIAKMAFEAGSEGESWESFKTDLPSFELDLTDEDILLIRRSHNDGSLRMTWEEFMISPAGKRAVSNMDNEKLSDAFNAGKEINYEWETFASLNGYPINKEQASKSEIEMKQFESMYTAFNAPSLKREWSLYGYLSGNKGWNTKDPKFHDKGEITAQIVIGSILLSGSFFVLVMTLINRGRTLLSNSDSLVSETGVEVTFDSIFRIDSRKWDKKGLAYLYFKDENSSVKKLVIDDLKYKGSDAILDRIKDQFTGELLESYSDESTSAES